MYSFQFQLNTIFPKVLTFGKVYFDPLSIFRILPHYLMYYYLKKIKMTDKRLQSIGFLYACIILVVVLVPHISALLNVPSPWEFSYIKTFIAIFFLWGFMIFFMNKTITVTDEESETMSVQDRLKRLLNNPPHWLFVLTLLSYAYGSYWFLSGFTHFSIDPELEGGRYQTFNHGTITYFTEAEYQKVHRQHLLHDTGLLFLFASFALQYFFP